MIEQGPEDQPSGITCYNNKCSDNDYRACFQQTIRREGLAMRSTAHIQARISASMQEYSIEAREATGRRRISLSLSESLTSTQHPLEPLLLRSIPCISHSGSMNKMSMSERLESASTKALATKPHPSFLPCLQTCPLTKKLVSKTQHVNHKPHNVIALLGQAAQSQQQPRSKSDSPRSRREQ